MLTKYDSQGNIDLEATGRAAVGVRVYIAAEALQSIRALAADARQHQWLHRQTGEALDKILDFAKVGVSALTDEEDEDGEDFPP